MNKSGKIWGETFPLFCNIFVEFSRVFIKPHHHCSLHRHKHKSNLFYVISGKLVIEVHKNDYELVDVTTLEPGDLCTVKPGEFHVFRSLDEPVEALELYYPEPLSPDDIERRNCGGAEGT
jgi:mannose-6-phosphate isomerase-like protein (cupin superfamily)